VAPPQTPEKKDWRQRCREYQQARGVVIPPPKAPEPEMVGRETGLSIGEIIVAVTSFYGLFQTDIVSQRRDHRVSTPRLVVYYLAKKLTTRSLPMIGKAIGFRDQSTVMSGCRKIERLIANEAPIKSQIETIERHLIEREPLPKFERAPTAGLPDIKIGPWSDEETQFAIQLCGEGFSHRQIGDKIGRSKHQVRSRLVKLGVPSLRTLDRIELDRLAEANKCAAA
jgi:hypothetical protein